MIGLTESINRTLKGLRFTIHTGLKVSPFKLHQRRKPRTELENIIKRNKGYLSDWTTSNVSVSPKQIPIYVAQNEKSEVTDHMIMARKRKTPCCTSHRSPKWSPVKPVSENFQNPHTFFWETEPKKIFRKDIQRATENCHRRHQTYGPYCRQQNLSLKININANWISEITEEKPITKQTEVERTVGGDTSACRKEPDWWRRE